MALGKFTRVEAGVSATMFGLTLDPIDEAVGVSVAEAGIRIHRPQLIRPELPHVKLAEFQNRHTNVDGLVEDEVFASPYCDNETIRDVLATTITRRGDPLCSAPRVDPEHSVVLPKQALFMSL
jgi:hypothetical protein